MSEPKKPQPAGKAKAEARKARLAAALRSNLLKRKEKATPKEAPRDRNEGETALGAKE
jgi:hypothetical protein